MLHWRLKMQFFRNNNRCVIYSSISHRFSDSNGTDFFFSTNSNGLFSGRFWGLSNTRNFLTNFNGLFSGRFWGSVQWTIQSSRRSRGVIPVEELVPCIVTLRMWEKKGKFHWYNRWLFKIHDINFIMMEICADFYCMNNWIF